ncbi:MAG: hypothetical protein WDN04_12970 [Rhodospirillales bacterium]
MLPWRCRRSPIAPLLAVSIPGLLALIDGAATWRSAFRRGMAFGVGHHLVGLYWITSAILVEGSRLLVGLCRSAFRCWRQCWRYSSPCRVGAARLVPAGWPRAAIARRAHGVLGDIARQFVLTGFPWNPLGSAVEMPGMVGLAFMQAGAWVGIGGITLFVVLLAATPALRAARAWFAALAAIPAVGHRPALPALHRSHPAAAGSDRGHRAGQRFPRPSTATIGRTGAWIDRIFNRHLGADPPGRIAGGRSSRACGDGRKPPVPYWLEEDTEARQAIAEGRRAGAGHHRRHAAT